MLPKMLPPFRFCLSIYNLQKGVTKLGLGPLGAIIAIGIALVAMFYSMKFLACCLEKKMIMIGSGWRT